MTETSVVLAVDGMTREALAASLEALDGVTVQERAEGGLAMDAVLVSVLVEVTKVAVEQLAGALIAAWRARRADKAAAEHKPATLVLDTDDAELRLQVDAEGRVHGLETLRGLPLPSITAMTIEPG